MCDIMSKIPIIIIRSGIDTAPNHFQSLPFMGCICQTLVRICTFVHDSFVLIYQMRSVEVSHCTAHAREWARNGHPEGWTPSGSTLSVRFIGFGAGHACVEAAAEGFDEADSGNVLHGVDLGHLDLRLKFGPLRIQNVEVVNQAASVSLRGQALRAVGGVDGFGFGRDLLAVGVQIHEGI